MALGFFSKLLSYGVPEKSTPIMLFNTLRKQKEIFRPLRAGHVGMYNCGPTVYYFQHIGNYRAYVFADMVKRVFLYYGFNVKQVINITDVGHLTGDNEGDASVGEDRIEKAAKREHKTAAEIIKIYTDDFLENLLKLNIDTEGTEFPRATENILEQVAFIKTLEEKGYVYKTSDGIYFDASLFKEYGKLGNINIKGLQEGARVEANPEKKHPTDFALWKFSKPNEKREQEWESPWGVGFPGWHIECSAMSAKYLGHRFDIHTGGVDHIPVHHQNEIAQSEAAFGRPFVTYWLHVAHLMIDGKKISKSLGNGILIKHIEHRKISPLAYRYWLLTSHYRTQVNFTWEALEAAHRAFFKLERFFAEDLGAKKGKANTNYQSQFRDAINDDLDTPKAVAVLWNLVKDEKISKPDKKATLLDFDRVLGLNLSQSQDFIEESTKPVAKADIPKDVAELLDEREKARADKNFTKADELRDRIKDTGFLVEDSPTGPRLTKN